MSCRLPRIVLFCVFCVRSYVVRFDENRNLTRRRCCPEWEVFPWKVPNTTKKWKEHAWTASTGHSTIDNVVRAWTDLIHSADLRDLSLIKSKLFHFIFFFSSRKDEKLVSVHIPEKVQKFVVLLFTLGHSFILFHLRSSPGSSLNKKNVWNIRRCCIFIDKTHKFNLMIYFLLVGYK